MAKKARTASNGKEGTLNMFAVILLMLSGALIVALAVKIWG